MHVPVIKVLLQFFCLIFSIISGFLTRAIATVLSVSAHYSGLSTKWGDSGLMQISFIVGLAPWAPCGASPSLHQCKWRIRVRLLAFATSFPEDPCSRVCLCNMSSEYIHSVSFQAFISCNIIFKESLAVQWRFFFFFLLSNVSYSRIITFNYWC